MLSAGGAGCITAPRSLALRSMGGPDVVPGWLLEGSGEAGSFPSPTEFKSTMWDNAIVVFTDTVCYICCGFLGRNHRNQLIIAVCRDSINGLDHLQTMFCHLVSTTHELQARTVWRA